MRFVTKEKMVLYTLRLFLCFLILGSLLGHFYYVFYEGKFFKPYGSFSGSTLDIKDNEVTFIFSIILHCIYLVFLSLCLWLSRIPSNFHRYFNRKKYLSRKIVRNLDNEKQESENEGI